MTETAADRIDCPPAIAATFDEARARFEALIFSFVSRRVRPIEEAEDVVAEVFVDAYCHWQRRRGDPRLWLLGIARRKVADALRRKRHAWQIRESELSTDAMAAFMAHAEARTAAEIVDRLPVLERDALLLQVLEELPIAEIAVVLGRSPAATNSLLQRARARVRRLVSEVQQ